MFFELNENKDFEYLDFLGKNMKYLRSLFNISQSNLAELLSVTSATISRYENSEREPGLEILYKLSRIFNVSIDTLLLVDIENESGNIINNEYIRNMNNFINYSSNHCLNDKDKIKMLINFKLLTENTFNEYINNILTIDDK